MTRILGEHGNFNRISFGDSLWTSIIIRPSIADGCVVWFPSAISDAQNIESLQYQVGKLLWKQKWAFQNLLFYQNLSVNQLTNFLTDSVLIILQDLMNFRLTGPKNSECVEWKYVNHMKNIFQSIGLDHYYYGNFNTNIFKHFFGKAVQDKELSKRLEMSSLSN